MKSSSSIAVLALSLIFLLLGLKILFFKKEDTVQVSPPVTTKKVNSSIPVVATLEKVPTTEPLEAPRSAIKEKIVPEKGDTTGQSTIFGGVKKKVAEYAFEAFMVDHLKAKIFTPFISFEDFTLSSLGPNLSLFETTDVTGIHQMMIFIGNGQSSNLSSIYNFIEVNSSSVSKLGGTFPYSSASDSSGEAHFLIKTKVVNEYAVTLIWKKYNSKHSEEEIRLYQRAIQ